MFGGYEGWEAILLATFVFLYAECNKVVDQIEVQVKDMNFGHKISYSFTRSNNLVEAQVSYNHAYFILGKTDGVTSAQWLWNVHPENKLYKGPQFHFHFKDETFRKISIHVNTTVSELDVVLLVNRPIKTTRKGPNELLVYETALFSDAPNNPGEVTSFLVLVYSNRLQMLLKSVYMKISAIIKQPQGQINYDDGVWESVSINSRKMKCYEAVERDPYALIDEWKGGRVFKDKVQVSDRSYRYFCSFEFTYIFWKASLNSVAVLVNYKSENYLTEIDVCVHEIIRCRPPEVAIERKNLENKGALPSSPADKDVTLAGSITAGKCFSEKKAVAVTWHVISSSKFIKSNNRTKRHNQLSYKRLNDVDILSLRHAATYTWNESFVLRYSANTLSPRKYVVVLAAHLQPYCGNFSYFVMDYVEMKITKPAKKPPIAGGEVRLWSKITQDPYLKVDASEFFRQGPPEAFRLLWFCHRPVQKAEYKKEEKDLTERLIHDLPILDKNIWKRHGGCFGHGFVLTPGDLYQTSKEENAVKSVIKIPKGRLESVNGIYIFTIVTVWKPSGIVKNSQQVVKLTQATPRQNQEPLLVYYVSMECLSNCGNYLIADQILHLVLRCTVCNEDIELFNEGLTPKWKLKTPDRTEEIEIVQDPTIAVESNIPVFTLDPSKLSAPGEYLFGPQYLERSFYEVNVTPRRYKFSIDPRPVEGYCHVRPSIGVAVETLFTVECFNLAPGDSFSLTYSITSIRDQNLNEDQKKNRPDLQVKTETVLLRGGSQSATEPATFEGINLPLGDRKKGARLTLKITAINPQKDRSSTSTEIVVVRPKAENRKKILEDSLIGRFSSLGTAVREGNIYQALRLASSAASLIAEDPNAHSTVDLSIAAIDHLVQLLKTSNDSSAILDIMLAVADISENWNDLQAELDQGKLDDLVRSVREALTAFNDALRQFPIPDLPEKDSEVIQSAALTSLRLITNTVKFLGTVFAVNPTATQSELLALRSNFIDILRMIRRKSDVSVRLIVNNCETIEFLKVSRIDEDVKIGDPSKESGAAHLQSIKDVTRYNFVALSTLYYNPFATRDPSRADNDINLPVIAISAVPMPDESRTIFNSERPKYNILLPLNDLEEGDNNILKTKESVSVYLPDPCSGSRVRSALEEGAVLKAENVDSTCGPISVEIDISAYRELDPVFPLPSGRQDSPERVLGYLTLKPEQLCHDIKKPCLRVSFVKTKKSSVDCKATDTTCIDEYQVVTSVLLPRKSSSPTSGENYRENAWSVPLREKLLKAINTQNKTSFALIENLQQDPLAQSKASTEKYRKVPISVIRAECFVWSESSNTWDLPHCSEGAIAVNDKLRCQCSAPSENDVKLTNSKLPFFFCGKMFAIPKFINFKLTLSQLLQLNRTPYVIVVVTLIWIAFIPFIYWSWRRDKQDDCLPPIYIPEDCDGGDVFLYEVVIFTSVFNRAGTTADVTMVLEGSSGVQTAPHVISDLSKKFLQRGSVDTYLITSDKPLGKVTTIRLWHDNAGSSPGWYLDRVAVYDWQSSDTNSQTSLFVANKWLSIDFFPYLCHVELHESDRSEFTSSGTIWRINLFYQLQEDNPWTAMFNRTTGNSFTRLERCASCMVGVLGTMLATMMFYDVSNITSFDLKIGQISVDYESIVIGTEAAILTGPINLLIDYLFRKIRPYETNAYDRCDCDDLESTTTDTSDYLDANRLRDKELKKGSRADQTSKRTSFSSQTIKSQYTKNHLNAEKVMSPSSGIPSRYTSSSRPSVHFQRAEDLEIDYSTSSSETTTVFPLSTITEGCTADFTSETSTYYQFSAAETEYRDISSNEPSIHSRSTSDDSWTESVIDLQSLRSGYFRSVSQPDGSAMLPELGGTTIDPSLMRGNDTDDGSFTDENLEFFDASVLCLKNNDVPNASVTDITANSKSPSILCPASAAGPSVNTGKPEKNQERIWYHYNHSNASPLLDFPVTLQPQPTTLNGHRNSKKSRSGEVTAVKPSAKSSRQDSTFSNIAALRALQSNPPQEIDEKYFPQANAKFLPECLHYFAWGSVIAYLIACTVFGFFYGLQLGDEKFRDWFITFISSIIQNIIIFTPLRLVLVAFLETLACGDTFNQNDWLGIQEERDRHKTVERWKRIHENYTKALSNTKKLSLNLSEFNMAFFNASEPSNLGILMKRTREIQKRPWCYKLPNFGTLMRSGRLKIAVSQVKQFWVEALSWVFMVAVVTSLLILQRDVRLAKLNNRLEINHVRHFEKIKTIDQHFGFLENSLIPTLFNVDGVTEGDRFALLGAIRLRQVRLNSTACNPALPERLKKKECKVNEYDVGYFTKYETNDYLPHWKPNVYLFTSREQILGDNDDMKKFLPIINPWHYTDLGNTRATEPLPGHNLQREYYPNGGYILDLRGDLQDILASIRGMRSAGWIDDGTAAIFTEYTVYTDFNHHVTSVFLAVEALSIGSVNRYHRVHTFKPPYLYSYMDLIIIGLQLLHVIIIAGLIYEYANDCRESKRHRVSVLRIIFNTWNLATSFTVLLSIVSYIFYFVYIYYSVKIFAEFKEDPEKYTPFSTVARYEKVYFTVLSFAAFFSYLRIVKIFRSSTTVTVMIDALSKADEELLNLTLVTMLCIFAFSHTTYLALGSARTEFRSFGRGCISLLALVVGIELPFRTYSASYEVLWSAIYITFLVMNMIFFINMYAAVVEGSFRRIKKIYIERGWDPIETLAVIWIFENLVTFLGKAVGKSTDKYLKDRSKVLSGQGHGSHIVLQTPNLEDLGKKRGTLTGTLIAKRESVRPSIPRSVKELRLSRNKHSILSAVRRSNARNASKVSTRTAVLR